MYVWGGEGEGGGGGLEVLVSLNKSIRNYFSTISVWWVVARNK